MAMSGFLITNHPTRMIAIILPMRRHGIPMCGQPLSDVLVAKPRRTLGSLAQGSPLTIDVLSASVDTCPFLGCHFSSKANVSAANSHFFQRIGTLALAELSQRHG